ncbi:MAG: hypothetical protein ACO3NL_02570, partial [Phycisphaerales bacterium]
MSQRRPSLSRRLTIAAASIAALGAVSILGAGSGKPPRGQVKIPATENDFLQTGTQPSDDPYQFQPIVESFSCTYCHSDYDIEDAPYDTWVVSMKGQSARDPVWHAALAIANQDVNLGGETCLRCHAPGAWLGGRSFDGTTDHFQFSDFDGINCNFCHRVVNPVPGELPAVGYPGDDPDPDTEILTALAKDGLLPTGFGNARYVVDPIDSRRAPADDVPQNLHGLDALGDPIRLVSSPFHKTGEFCATCHDVSNPLTMRTVNKKGEVSYALAPLDEPHPTQDPRDMFPEQRTYSEWRMSLFASEGVSFPDNRYGGNHPTGVMSSCQDCHMPDQVGGGCAFWENPPFFERQHLPQHAFNGANTWVMEAIRLQLGDEADFFGITEERLDEAKSRTIASLRNASDMELSQEGDLLKVRVINQTGHKLPTGYPEGRRMWLNVRFLNAKGGLVKEHGGYDFKTATLATEDTKVYEAKHGLDEQVANFTGLPVGKSFHLSLNNKVYSDNRIPPRGFTIEGFESVQAEPVAYHYEDGQYWDDTTFTIPAGAARAVVVLYYQTSSREYIEFLRDANTTNDRGEVLYDLWLQSGRSAPVDMDAGEILLSPSIPGDLNGDG